MPSSRRCHTAGLERKIHQVELNQIRLDWLLGCDLDKGCGWFWRWMASHHLV